MMSAMNTGVFHIGECLELMARLPDASVDMVLCDLPYGTTQNKWDSIIPLDRLWEEYWRVTKPRAPVVLTAQAPFDKQLGASCLEHMKYEWIWFKSRATGHLNAKKQPMRAHENILVFYRDSPTYNPQGLIKKAIPTIRRGGDNGTNYGLSDKDSLQEYSGYPTSVIQIPSQGGGFHPTQKPVALFEYLIRTYSNPGDVILDNTAGSGTTAIAAINAGRRWICMEQDEGYAAKAIERIQQHTHV